MQYTKHTRYGIPLLVTAELLVVAFGAILGVLLGSWSLARSVPASIRAHVSELEGVALEALKKSEAQISAYRDFVQQVESFLEAISEKSATIERKRRSTAAAATRADQAVAQDQPASRSEHLQQLRQRAGLI